MDLFQDSDFVAVHDIVSSPSLQRKFAFQRLLKHLLSLGQFRFRRFLRRRRGWTILIDDNLLLVAPKPRL
jgi:hypothetical protein